MDYSSLMGPAATQLAAAIRAGDSEGAASIMALLAIQVAAVMAAANAAAQRAPMTDIEAVQAQFRTALASERLSTSRHAKATGAFDMVLMTHHQIGLGLSVI